MKNVEKNLNIQYSHNEKVNWNVENIIIGILCATFFPLVYLIGSILVNWLG